MLFKALGRREVRADFSGGRMTSDAGAVLLREVDNRIGLLDRVAKCFRDHRDPRAVEHTPRDLLAQRIFGLALGYEDLNDHDELSTDPLLATVVGKPDPTGKTRRRAQDRGRPLATRSTLNRLELTPQHATASARYKKIVADFDALERTWVEVFLESRLTTPKQIVLDLDATDDRLHGQQEGRFFHGYYKSYCYLPLYVFCGDDLLVAKLRPSNIDASAGTVEVLEWLIPQIRAQWPHVRIILRADSGFARDAIMSWCESQDQLVHYVLGLAKNSRLTAAIEPQLAHAQAQWETTGEASREFKDFRYQTLNSWSAERRVVAKAEHLHKGANPRFIVTNLDPQDYAAQGLYEELYCARGEMENRIKEQQLCLFADRTSTAFLRSNQLRLWFSSAAYVLLSALRRLALRGTKLARARCDTIRLRLLKIGAQVRVTVRRVWVRMASSYPYQELFAGIWRQLQSTPLRC
jgi:hypothetical protein